MIMKAKPVAAVASGPSAIYLKRNVVVKALNVSTPSGRGTLLAEWVAESHQVDFANRRVKPGLDPNIAFPVDGKTLPREQAAHP